MRRSFVSIAKLEILAADCQLPVFRTMWLFKSMPFVWDYIEVEFSTIRPLFLMMTSGAVIRWGGGAVPAPHIHLSLQIQS